jgi:hypothetical protein
MTEEKIELNIDYDVEMETSFGFPMEEIPKDDDIYNMIDDIRKLDFDKDGIIYMVNKAKSYQNSFNVLLAKLNKEYADISKKRIDFMEELSNYIKSQSGKVEVRNIIFSGGTQPCRIVIDDNGMRKIPYKRQRGIKINVKELIQLVSNDRFMSKVNIAFANDKILKLRFECLIKVLARLGELNGNLQKLKTLGIQDITVPNKFCWNNFPIKSARIEFSAMRFCAKIYLVMYSDEKYYDNPKFNEVVPICYNEFDDFVKIMPLLPNIIPILIKLIGNIISMSKEFSDNVDSLRHDLAPIYALENI